MRQIFIMLRFNFKEKTNLDFDGFNAKINNFVNEIKLEVLFFALNNYSVLFYNQKNLKDNHFDRMKHGNPSITDGVHRNENFVEIIPVFSTLSNFFKKRKKKKKRNYKSHLM